MKRTRLTLLIMAALLGVSGTASAQSARGAARVDFDDQLIQGQVNKGAVHLIERKDSDLGSLVKVRKSFRAEILAGTEIDTAKKTAVEPVTVAMAAPVLPVVKAEAAAPVAEPAKKVSAKSAKAAKSAKPAKPSTKSAAPKATTKLGGSRAISRR